MTPAQRRVAGDLARGAAAASGSGCTTTSSTSAGTRCCWSRLHARLQRELGARPAARRSVPAPDRRVAGRAPGGARSPTTARAAPRPANARARQAHDVAADACPRDAVAIIGMAGRFPGADDLDGFWDEPARRRRVDRVLHATTSCARAGVAGGAAGRSALRARAARARRRRPVRRRLLRLYRRAKRRSSIRSSGCSSSAPGRRWSTPATTAATCTSAVGVFAGASMNTYLLTTCCRIRRSRRRSAATRLMLGNDKDFLPTRVSYKLTCAARA